MMGKQKFRDPKTGEVLDTIGSVWKRVCTYPNNICSCSLFKKTKCDRCFAWCADHHSEAATLMGYEVIEDEKEVNMEKKDKPRLAEVLGLREGERIRVVDGEYKTPWMDVPEDDEKLMSCECAALIHAIYHPESIIRAPRLTEAELERCRVMGAKWVTRDNRWSYRVELWDFKPRKTEEDVYVPAVGDHSLAVVYEGLFPSVHPGDCIEAEVTGE